MLFSPEDLHLAEQLHSCAAKPRQTGQEIRSRQRFALSEIKKSKPEILKNVRQDRDNRGFLLPGDQ
jgi:hypothetical protein